VKDYTKLPYRMGAIGIVLDKENKVLIVQLNDYSDNEWNFPGGGRRGGEDGQKNVLRELSEELNVDEGSFKILFKSSSDVVYDFPEDMREKEIPRALKYRGQIKEQFFVRFLGKKENISIDRDEIKDSRWVVFAELKKFLIFEGQYDKFIRDLDEFLTAQIRS
jgi:putative (di)nucleoside polyphosphate hydrolase